MASVPNTFRVQPAQFWQEGDENKVEVVRTQEYDATYSNSDVWRLTGPELVALVDAITASDAWQTTVRGGTIPAPRVDGDDDRCGCSNPYCQA